MITVRKIAPVFALWVLCAAPAHARGVSLRVQANRQEIYARESVSFSVLVDGEDDPRNPPDLSAIRDFTVRFVGTHSRSRRGITIINGRVTRTGSYRRRFDYALEPKRTGKLRAGPIRLRTGGRVLEDAGPVIQVTGIEEQDFVIIRVVPSKTEVLVDEAFTVTLSVLVKRLPGRFRDASPVDPGHPPSLSVPYLSGQPIKGLEGPDIDRALARIETRSPNAPGFTINGRPASRTSIFDMPPMFERRLARYALRREGISENGQEYYRHSFALSYTPTEEGSHTFGPVVFKGTIISDATPDGRAVGKNIFAVGPAATVRVVPPPEEGRPETYLGAVGTNVNVVSSLDAQTCQVGDPLTLTLDITGAFHRENVRTPILGDRPGISRNFRVYDDTVQTVRTDDGIRYTYTIRPTPAGTIELPPIKISYYDTSENAYKTVSTKPIPVQARAGAQVDKGTIIGNATNTVVLGGGTGVDDLFVVAPLNVDPAGAQFSPITPRAWHFLVALVGPVALALAGAGRLLQMHSAALGALRRRHSVLNDVSSGLRRAGRTAESERAAANRELCGAIRLYLSWHFDVPETSLTPADAKRLLEGGGVDRQRATRLQDILEHSFNAAYAGMSDPDRDIGKDCREADELIKAIHAERQKRGGEQ